MKITNKFNHSLETTGLEFIEGKKVNKNLILRIYRNKARYSIVGLENKFYEEEFLIKGKTLQKIMILGE